MKKKNVSVVSPSIVLFATTVGVVLLWNLKRDLGSIRPLPKARMDSPVRAAPVLIVIIAVDMAYSGVTAESHRSYADRYGYRLVIQRQWRGTSIRPEHRIAARTQKLLACSHERGEQYVLVLDADTVISPATPPIHTAVDVVDKIGVVDEDQPTPAIRASVEAFRLHGRRPVTDAPTYYAPFGQFRPEHGVLNTGVLLVQPKKHCAWLHTIFYTDKAQKWFSKRRVHYDQPVLGAAMLSAKNYKLLPHAWNRGWVFYKYGAKVGGPTYDIGEVFERSYITHFYWEKSDLGLLRRWMRTNNVTFDPKPFATNLLP